MLDAAVLEFSTALWMHEGTRDSKSTLIHCCAVLGIHEHYGTYRRLENYGQDLAGLLYCARLLLFEHALPKARRRSIADLHKAFLKVHYRWLVDGRPTPFHYIDNLLAYALRAGRDAGGKPRAFWTPDRQTLIY